MRDGWRRGSAVVITARIGVMVEMAVGIKALHHVLTNQIKQLVPNSYQAIPCHAWLLEDVMQQGGQHKIMHGEDED